MTVYAPPHAPAPSSAAAARQPFELAESPDDEGSDGGPRKPSSRDASPSPAPPTAALIVPSWGKLASFLATTCCLWLSEPLLSLVDTTFVSWSQQGSDQLVTQLAAMGLATTLMDTLVYTTYFLAIATTTQIAEQVAHRHYRQLQLSTSRLLGFAVLCGSLVTLLTWAFAGSWLRKLAGSEYDHSAPELVPLATDFVRIRAAVAPLTVSGMVAHSFCLVTDHAGTVALAVLASALTNVLLDVLLTPAYGMLGAACATATATSLSALIMLHCVCNQMKVWRLQEVQESAEGKEDDDPADGVIVVKARLLDAHHTKEAGDSEDDRSVGDREHDRAESQIAPLPPSSHAKPPLLQQLRTLVNAGHSGNGHCHSSNASHASNSSASSASPPDTAALYSYNKQPVPMISLPDREAMVQLLKLSLPLAFYMWAETASYASLTIAATEFGPVALAAQNVLMQVFHVLCCVSESLAQAAQAYLPATLYPRYHPASFQEVLVRLCRVAAVVAVIGYQLSLGILGGGTGARRWIGSGHGGAHGGAIPIAASAEGGGEGSSSSLLEDALDPEVVRQLQLAAPYLAACLCLHPFNAVIEGTVIATRDFGNIVRTYAVTLLAFGTILRSPTTTDLAGVWRALVAWQLLRMFNYGWWRRRSGGVAASPADGADRASLPPSLPPPPCKDPPVGPKPDPSGVRCCHPSG